MCTVGCCIGVVAGCVGGLGGGFRESGRGIGDIPARCVGLPYSQGLRSSRNKLVSRRKLFRSRRNCPILGWLCLEWVGTILSHWTYVAFRTSSCAVSPAVGDQ